VTGYFAASGFNNLLEGGDAGGGQPALRTSTRLVASGILCSVLDRVVRRRKIISRQGLRARVVELPQPKKDLISQPEKNPE
jgi:hypothetical protein